MLRTMAARKAFQAKEAAEQQEVEQVQRRHHDAAAQDRKAAMDIKRRSKMDDDEAEAAWLENRRRSKLMAEADTNTLTEDTGPSKVEAIAASLSRSIPMQMPGTAPRIAPSRPPPVVRAPVEHSLPSVYRASISYLSQPR